MGSATGTVSRREFLGAGAAIALAPAALADRGATVPVGGVLGPLPDGHPRQPRELVEEMVSVSHFSIDRVRDLLERAPDLAKATRDWGFGDWETALGAASHTGNREIALLLMEHGAPPDLFTHAMLGHTDVVRTIIESQPGAARIRGPHGITLLEHARAGGERARKTLEYLGSIDGADEPATSLELSERERAACIGAYRYDGAPEDATLEIAWSERHARLTITHAGQGPQRLNHRGGRAFAPAGAPGVRIVFLPRDGNGAADALRIEAPEPVATASRIG